MLPEYSHKIKPSIKIRYGPYEANGFIKHREEKLSGLIACLKELEYEVELIPSACLNMLVVEILGYEVYKGSIKFLLFNMDCEDDVVCQNIVCKVKEAVHRMYNPERNDNELTDIQQSINYILEDKKCVVSENMPEDQTNFFRDIFS